MDDDLLTRTLTGLLTSQHEMSGQIRVMAGQMQALAGQMDAFATTSQAQEARLQELLGLMAGFAQGQVRQEQTSIRALLEEYGRRLEALERKAS